MDHFALQITLMVKRHKWRDHVDSENNRIEIDDLPRSAEELTDDEAKDVQGGLTKVGAGTLVLGNSATGNTIGGALSNDQLDTSRKAGDGSV